MPRAPDPDEIILDEIDNNTVLAAETAAQKGSEEKQEEKVESKDENFEDNEINDGTDLNLGQGDEASGANSS